MRAIAGRFFFARSPLILAYQRPYLYPKQEEALFCEERIATIEASTKSGKTVGAIAWLVEETLRGKAGQNYWWVAPGYNQAEIAYRRIKMGLTRGSFTAFETPTPRIKLINDAWIWFKSADNADSLYGEDVYAAVADEASRMSTDSYHAIYSTLTATRGKLRAIGNVKGRKNWFYDLCRRAQADMRRTDGKKPTMRYSKITADDAVAAGVLNVDAIEEARRDLPETIFRELYYAEPGDDTGNPFGMDHIAACVRPGFGAGPVVAWGIDLAKKQDYFVCVGLNANGEVAAFERWRGVPWRESIKRVWALVGEDTPAMVDSTGVGDPVLEELQHEHGNFHGFTFSATSKQKLMEGLAVSIQSHEISFPDGLIRFELDLFEYVEKPTGIRYAAPPGEHDDCVCALALARQMWTETLPGQNIMAFYANVSERLTQRAKLPAPDNNRPWRDQGDALVVPVTDIIENELEEVYHETVMQAFPNSKRLCGTCGAPVVGGTRVTDGEFVWHPHCAGPGARVIREAQVVT